MSVGQRIKERLKELEKDVKWLHRQTRVPVSSLYEIMNGRMQSTTRLPTIAAALDLRAVWLERGAGPRLVSDPDLRPSAKDPWPFSFERARFDALSKTQRKHIDLLLLQQLQFFEQGTHDGQAKRHAG